MSGSIASAAQASLSPLTPRLRTTPRGLSSSNCATSDAIDAKEWLEENFDAIGVESTLDIDRALKRDPGKTADEGRACGGLSAAARLAAIGS